jgi:hypothetical protein
MNTDLFFAALTLAFFAASALYARFCESLR